MLPARGLSFLSVLVWPCPCTLASVSASPLATALATSPFPRPNLLPLDWGLRCASQLFMGSLRPRCHAYNEGHGTLTQLIDFAASPCGGKFKCGRSPSANDTAISLQMLTNRSIIGRECSRLNTTGLDDGALVCCVPSLPPRNRCVPIHGHQHHNRTQSVHRPRRRPRDTPTCQARSRPYTRRLLSSVFYGAVCAAPSSTAQPTSHTRPIQTMASPHLIQCHKRGWSSSALSPWRIG